MKPRYDVIDLADIDKAALFARDVRAGLSASPKHLPCRQFYDQHGSCLFEEICRLPEYYLTRAEYEILEGKADQITASLPRDVTLVDLGSGSAEKTRLLLAALCRRRGAPLQFIPVDIERSVLDSSAATLLDEFPELWIRALVAEYGQSLPWLREHVPGAKCVLWLGSNIGNLHRPQAAQMLTAIRVACSPGDRLLVGIDLRKDRRVLEAAYDDGEGVTARFNLNLLARIDRELGGQFGAASFQHRAVYLEGPGRVEMHLVSTRRQQVLVGALDLVASFEAGEPIHTEDCYKYSPEEIDAIARAAGLRLVAQWLDSGSRFSSNLFFVE